MDRGLQFGEFSIAKGGPLKRGFPPTPPTGEMGRHNFPQHAMEAYFSVYCNIVRTAVADALFVLELSLWAMKMYIGELMYNAT